MRFLHRFLRWILLLGFGATFMALLTVAGVYSYYAPHLPSIEALRDVRFQVPLKIYARNHDLIAEFGEKRRSPIAYADIPTLVIQAFLAAEDNRYFEHPGVDYQGLIRAATQLIITGHKKQGGSTITMQVARNFFLSPERTYERKIKEILLALKIERSLNKEQILELYLNKIYLGKRAYGIGAAAEVYYGKPLEDLNIAQIAMVAGLPKAPSSANPIANPERAIIRRNYVLDRMLQLGFINKAAHEAAKNAPVTAQVHAPVATVAAPHAAEMVRAQMVEAFGDAAYTDGYEVVTTLAPDGQTLANNALRQALEDYDRRHGYRGPVDRPLDINESNDLSAETMESILANYPTIGVLTPGIVEQAGEQLARIYIGAGVNVELDRDSVRWARPHVDENTLGPAPDKVNEVVATGDVIYVRQHDNGRWLLAQIPKVSGALIALNPHDGAILSLVGSYDFNRSKFNRAAQSKRQPGSGFKPVLYTAALEAGFTPATTINDAPVVFKDPTMQGGAWRPENYSNKFFGPTRLRKAFYKSRNVVSVRLLDAVGIPATRAMAQRLGFLPEEVPNSLTIALGSGTAVPLRMSAVYAIFANGGFRITPYLIDEVRTTDGKLALKADPKVACQSCSSTAEVNHAASDDTALLMPLSQYLDGHADDLSGEGPRHIRLAERILSPQVHYQMTSMLKDVIKKGTGRRAMQLDRWDLAGKTGTTNEQRDAWFNGFNPDLVATTWVGFDDQAPLGKKETGSGAALPMWISYMREALKGKPERTLIQPDGIVTIKIDAATGLALGAGRQTGIFETFRKELTPEPAAEAAAGSATNTQPTPVESDIRESLF